MPSNIFLVILLLLKCKDSKIFSLKNQLWVKVIKVKKVYSKISGQMKISKNLIMNESNVSKINFIKGLFTYYVTQNSDFLDPLPFLFIWVLISSVARRVLSPSKNFWAVLSLVGGQDLPGHWFLYNLWPSPVERSLICKRPINHMQQNSRLRDAQTSFY